MSLSAASLFFRESVMFSRNSVTVITAATGHRRLANCLQSVQKQTFGDVEHLVVIDGEDRKPKATEILDTVLAGSKPRHVITLPAATGKNNWNGHRIYGAASFLANTEFVCYLDEDNWFDPDHVESLVAAVRHTPGATWAFSLRKIVDAHGQLIALDNCESLGHLHHVFDKPDDYHIDASCYLLSRTIAVAGSAVWYRPTRVGPGIPLLGQLYAGAGLRSEPDNAMCRGLLKNFAPGCTSGRHTLNYTVGNRPDSVQAEYFLHGNQMMKLMYPDGLPWEK
jgi:glycosyltransferase involved in cell wall biosynthesis